METIILITGYDILFFWIACMIITVKAKIILHSQPKIMGYFDYI